MSYKISKELFEAVIGEDYIERLVDILKCEEDAIRTYYDCGKFNDKGEPTGLGLEVSYNDFFFKCKEFALKQGYRLSSGFDIDMKTLRIPYCMCQYLNEEKGRWEDYTLFSDSEQQSVFDATQWLLENK